MVVNFQKVIATKTDSGICEKKSFKIKYIGDLSRRTDNQGIIQQYPTLHNEINGPFYRGHALLNLT